MECYVCAKEQDILYSCQDCKSEAGYCQDHRYEHEHVEPDPEPEPQTQPTITPQKSQSFSNTSIWREVENSYTTGKEWQDLLLGSILIVLIFTIIFVVAPNLRDFSFPNLIRWPFILAIGITASLAFLSHELSHKVLARRYGHDSRFILNVIYIAFSFVLALASWFSVIVGVTKIRTNGDITEDEAGMISAIGSFTNFTLGSISLLVVMILEASGVSIMILGLSLSLIFALFTSVNGAIGAIYMLPFGHLDGVKIWSWDKSFFAFLAIGNLLLWFVGY